MKKLQVFGISLFVFLIIFSNFVFALRVNEVMYNPNSIQGGSTNEWIELYFDSQTNLSNYALIEKQGASNRTSNLSGSFNVGSYLIIVNNISKFQAIWNLPNIIEIKLSLSNDGDSVWIQRNSSLVDYLSYNSSFGTNENGKSLGFCNGAWVEAEPTPGTENLCPIEQNQTNSQQNQTSSKIYLELEYDEEVGKDFEVNVKAFNLNGSYDIKIYLEDNGTIISEIYDVNWKSGSYYVNNFFNETGNKSGSLKLRLQKKYENFTGEAAIYGKIRNNDKIIDEFSDNITVIKEEETIIEKDSNDESLNGSLDLENIETASSIIRLNEPKDIKSAEIWKSKIQYIKEYAIYGFALLCVIVIILLLIRKWKK